MGRRWPDGGPIVDHGYSHVRVRLDAERKDRYADEEHRQDCHSLWGLSKKGVQLELIVLHF